jgi:Xaa-Pro aminopeptidase
MPKAGMMREGVFGKRLEVLRKRLDREGLRGAIVVPGPNMTYFTGVSSLLLERPFMLLVPVEGEPHLVAPTFEAGPYAEGPVAVKIHSWTDSEGWSGAIKKAAKGADLRGKWGVEGRAPFLFLDRLLKEASPKFRDAEPVLQGMRELKDEAEVRLLKKSASILSSAFEEFPALLKEGRTELEVAKGATDAIYAKGATHVDDMLVQSGHRCADPHGQPSAKKIQRGESIIIDVGATYQGYYSDITRAFCMGQNLEVEKVYDKVLEANRAGIAEAAKGVRVGDVDGAARGALKRAGLGKYFTHRTGHGLGLEIHEAPYIVEGGREKLDSGMCFTVEPGAYIRGKLGVRIEDDVLIEGKKGASITGTPKEFGWWK